MAHLQVIVDGETRYEGDVPNAVLPERPEMFPRALGGPGETSTPLQMPPLHRLMFLTRIIETICKVVESQMLRGTADVKFHSAGHATVEVKLPDITTMDDVRP